MIRKTWVLVVLAALSVAAQAGAAAVSDIARSAVEAARSYGAAVRSCDMGWALDYMYPPLKKTYAEQFSNRSGNERENARRVMGLTSETRAEARIRTQAELKALRDHYVQMGRQMIASGVKIESFVVGDPVAEYVVNPPSAMINSAEPSRWGDAASAPAARSSAPAAPQGQRERSRLVVLPTTLIVSGPSPQGGVSRVERRSHIYAIRDEVVNGGTDRNGLTPRDTKLNKWYFVDGNTDVTTLRAYFPNLPLRLTLPTGGERVLR